MTGRVSEEAIERRERLLATLRHPSVECAFCGEQGTDDNPLGLWSFGIDAHAECYAQWQADRGREIP